MFFIFKILLTSIHVSFIRGAAVNGERDAVSTELEIA
jgi:hypothetical protein